MPVLYAAKGWSRLLEGKYKFDPLYGGPEYETIGTFGSYCGIGDLAHYCPSPPDL